MYGQYLAKFTRPDPTTPKVKQLIGTADPRTNSNGISIDGRYETNKPHDSRIADNIVEDMSGAGIGAGERDRVQIENNIARDISSAPTTSTSSTTPPISTACRPT